MSNLINKLMSLQLSSSVPNYYGGLIRGSMSFVRGFLCNFNVGLTRVCLDRAYERLSNECARTAVLGLFVAMLIGVLDLEC